MIFLRPVYIGMLLNWLSLLENAYFCKLKY